MNKNKKAELTRIHKQFFDAGTGQKLSQPIAKFVDENVYGFGTAVDEKISGLKEFKNLLNNQKKQSKGIELKWKMKPLHCFISEDENNAVFSDELHLSVVAGGEHIRKYFRFSVVLNYVNNHWKVIHWHGSAPESIESNKDTFGINEWKQKTIELEKIVAERTTELTDKNRELEIEAALERVRAVTLAMKNSSEIKKVIFYLYQELTKLDAKLDRCFIMIVNSKTHDITWWMSGKEGLLSENGFLVQNNNFPSHQLYLHYWKKRKKKWQYVLQGKEKKEWDNFGFNKTGLVNLPEQVKKDMASVKKTYLSGSSDGFGCLITGSLEPLSNEHQEIISRFTVVFNQTYTRFREVQKAEAQSREAEIQLALERVRAKSLAMHQSDELADVVKLLYQEFDKLKVNNESTDIEIGLIDEKSGIASVWAHSYLSDGTIKTFNFPIAKFPATIDEFKKWKATKVGKRSELFFTTDLSGQKWKKIIDWASKSPEMKGINLSTIKSNIPRWVTHNAYFSHGIITLQGTQPYSLATQEILKRFAKVFEQTYTRFLDLQKAEAQAREAQIEVALERVRSRSMAMHKSDELKEVIRLVLEQFVHLNIKAEHAGFYIDYKAHDDMHIWLADPNLEPFFAVLPYFDTPTWNSFRDAKAKGKLLHTDLLDFKEKHKFYKALFKLFIVPEEAKEFYMNCKGLAVSTVLLDSVGLYIENFSAIPYTDEENNILMRFGKVFQQTYTRFLDLQKAEAQAREAQIEAALERVRARTMAMHNSSELAQAADLMFEQVQHLGAELQGVAFAICDKESDMVQKWTSIGIFSHPYNIEPGEQRMYEAWKNQSGLYEEVYEGEKQKKYYEAFMKIPSFREGIQKFIDSGYPLPTWQKNHAVPFKYGYLLFITTKPFDETQIFVRFGKVFEQTYTRFLDLQKAEAQTLRAEQDLIEIIASRKKAEDALTELQATQKQLIQSEKMASLGELTAGIAHEIQNPLNFVNNFSEVSAELVDEMNEEITKGNLDDAKEIANDLKQNLEKINHHGKRAGDIVKGMLQHSRTSSGQKESTDINALCDEYLRLAYHGLRAKDKSFNAKFETDFDESLSADKAGLPKINVVPQDIGRVILNLINNAFYAVNERKKLNESGYEPTVIVSTKKEGDKVLISVKDNGTGIPQNIVDKIFQPFFTTKPTGSGTGLGLSLSYDIIKAHGDELKVASKEGEGSEFVIYLPIALY